MALDEPGANNHYLIGDQNDQQKYQNTQFRHENLD